MSSVLAGAAPRPSVVVGGGIAREVPAIVEMMLVVAVILVLWPLFERLAPQAAGRDQRFLDRGIAVAGLPEPVVPSLCNGAAASAEPALAAALCGTTSARTARPLAAIPAALDHAAARAAQAFARPLREAEQRASTLRGSSDSDEDGEVRARTDALAAADADIAPFRERFHLGADGVPRPLACAMRSVEAVFAARLPDDGAVAARSLLRRADAALLLAAALDGRRATAGLAAEAMLPTAPAAPGCGRAAESLAATSLLMADARQSIANARKNDATRALVASAGRQWAAAMALGFVFVVWSRRAVAAPLGIAAALAAWAAAAWLARVPWPFASGGQPSFARAETFAASAPAPFVLALLGVAAAVALFAFARGDGAAPRLPPTAQAMSSRIGYPGFVLATGLGFLILLDLSLRGHAGNRYLALYHQGHLWLAMLTLSVLLFARRPLARSLAWLLSLGGEAMQRASRRFGAASVAALVVLGTAAAVLAFGIVLANKRQLTSELGRVWLIAGAAWFFFLRAGPLTERLARNGRALASLLRYAWPMLFVVAVLVGAMFATHDMGPLLIAGYAAGAFVAAALAMWWHHRSGQTFGAFALALLVFAAWIAAITAALFRVGAYDSVTASRLESVAAPFASINDQLALVSWFQRAAPLDGFGVGAAPWCGFAVSHACSGVPAQIHSDYTFTAIVGVFGPLVAWAVSVGMAVWLHRLIRQHGRVTRGEPRLVGGDGRLRHDGQALLSWLGVAWVVLTSCQLAVTVAGNLAVLPLTGVTFPFISFGMTSLLVNVAFLALCLNIDLPPRRGDD